MTISILMLTKLIAFEERRWNTIGSGKGSFQHFNYIIKYFKPRDKNKFMKNNNVSSSPPDLRYVNILS